MKGKNKTGRKGDLLELLGDDIWHGNLTWPSKLVKMIEVAIIFKYQNSTI